MKGFQKHSLALTVTILSIAVSQNANAYYKFSSHSRGGFYGGIEAFYAEGTDSLFDTTPYAATQPLLTPLVFDDTLATDTYDFFYNKPDEKWGYKLTLGYNTPNCNPCCNFGVSLDYTHFDTDNRSQTPNFLFAAGTPYGGEPSPVLFVPYVSSNINSLYEIFIPFLPSPNPLALFSQVSTYFEQNYDTVDFVGHVNHLVCNCLELQVFGGARYLRINEKIQTNANFTPGPELIETAIEEPFAVPLASIEDTINTDSKYTGIGPRVGATVYYPLPFVNCLGIVVEAAGNLTYGNSKSHYLEIGTIAPITPSDLAPITPFPIVTRNNESHRALVPSLSGKVGLALNIDFRNCSHLSIEAGYRTDKYFEAINNTALVNSVLTTNAYIPSKYNDFDLGGPYLSATWQI